MDAARPGRDACRVCGELAITIPKKRLQAVGWYARNATLRWWRARAPRHSGLSGCPAAADRGKAHREAEVHFTFCIAKLRSTGRSITFASAEKGLAAVDRTIGIRAISLPIKRIRIRAKSYCRALRIVEKFRTALPCRLHGGASSATLFSLFVQSCSPRCQNAPPDRVT